MLSSSLAWASDISTDIKPFGSDIFKSDDRNRQPALTNPNRLISYGDRLLVRLWGAINEEFLLMVDADGVVFIPESGPVRVQGKTLSQAKETISSSVAKIYNKNVQTHTTLADVSPISIFVTGNVISPGRYTGNQTDTIIDFLNKAQGISPSTGSYRQIHVKRGMETIAEVDMYDFLTEGVLPLIKFQNSDTIFVSDIGTEITALGAVRNSSSFEFDTPSIKLEQLIDIAKPNSKASHIKIMKAKGKNNSTSYLEITKAFNTALDDGDIVEFVTDKSDDTMSVQVSGEFHGQKSFIVKRNASLKELLSHIPVDPEFANISAIHIERKAVAAAQQKALNQSLFKLQQAALLKPSETNAEMQVRASEAKLIEAFVQQAKHTTMPGKVVIKNSDSFNDVRLEEGDKIIIPKRTEIVIINGQVELPNAFLHSKNHRIADYVHLAGGFTQNADQQKIILNRQDGSSKIVGINDKVSPGDTIHILPRVDEKRFIFAKEIVSVMYQIAVAANVLLPSL